MELEPWEALDVDDTDLSAYVRPCNSKTPLTADYYYPPLIPGPAVIPGPAGVIQAAMTQRRTGGGEGASDPLPTQEFVRRVARDGHDSDRDFKSNPWLSAMQFLRSQVGLVDDGDAGASATPLSSIKKHLNREMHLNPGIGRVSLVLAVIKSCTPNGFGDMTVTLKDPTGTVGASFHRRVFAEGGFGKDDITVGSVLLLQKVALFSPNISATCYLNITLPNIVKVFSRDSGPAFEPISVKRRTAPTSTEAHEKSLMPPGSAFPLPQGGTEGIPINLRLDSMSREVADIGKQTDEILVLTSCHPNYGNDQNQNIFSDSENLSPKLDKAGTVNATCGCNLENEMEDQTNLNKLGEGDSLAGIAGGSSLEHTSIGQETGVKIPMEQDIMNPISSIPHWTEEQLDELFAFD